MPNLSTGRRKRLRKVTILTTFNIQTEAGIRAGKTTRKGDNPLGRQSRLSSGQLKVDSQ
jgi:hypothetical protein